MSKKKELFTIIDGHNKQLRVNVLSTGQKLPGGWLNGDRHNDLKHLVHTLAELFDPACTRENKVYSKFTAGLIQQRLILAKREYVPSISAILYQLNTADKPMAITKGSKKMGYYSKAKLVESKKSILKAVVKK